MTFQITINFDGDAIQSKQSDYDDLVLRRKKCRACEGLCNPGSKELRKFDSDQIGPWTRLHGDLNASLMVVGQDWGDVNYYLQNSGLDKLNNPTMKNLQLLLNHIGMDVCMTKYGNPDAGLFLTNAVLCLKSGGMQAAIDPTWVTNCQNRFLKQQIEIVRPAVVVALGAKAFHASLQCFGFDKIQLSDAIVDMTGIEIVKGVRLFAAYHCGAGTINRNRNLRQQKKDWTRLGKVLGTKKS